MFGFGSSKKNEAKASGGFGLPGLSLGNAEKSLGQGLGQASDTLKNTGKKVEDLLFGHSGSRKSKNELSTGNEAKLSGGFGLPGLSLGNAKKSLGEGLGQASDTLKNTGKKVEDLLFGHPGSQKGKNELSTKSGVELSGNFGLPGSSLSGAEKSLGQGLGQASDTGKKVENLLFGHSGSKKSKNESFTGHEAKVSGFGLPGLSLGNAEKTLGQGLGQASDTLKNTGKKVENLLFGLSGSKKSNNESSIKNEAKVSGGFSLPGLSLGNAEKSLGQGLEQASDTLKNTGKKVEDLLFSQPGSQKSNNRLSLKNETKIGGGLGLPDSSFGKAEEAIGQGVGQASDTVQNTGKKVEDLLFGHSGSLKDKDELSLKNKTKLGGGLGLPDLSFGKAEEAVGQTLGQASNTLNNTGKKVEDLLFGHTSKNKGSNEFTVGIPATGDVSLDIGKNASHAQFGVNKTDSITLNQSTQLPKVSPPTSILGTPGLPNLSDVGKKVKDDIGKLGTKVEKTGEKVVDYIFGRKNSTTTDPSIDKLEKKTPDSSLGKTFNVTLKKKEATAAPPNSSVVNKRVEGSSINIGAENSTLKLATPPGIILTSDIGSNWSSADVNLNISQNPRTTVSLPSVGFNTISAEGIAANSENSTSPFKNSKDNSTEKSTISVNTEKYKEEKVSNKQNETMATPKTITQEENGRNKTNEVVIPPIGILNSTSDKDSVTTDVPGMEPSSGGIIAKPTTLGEKPSFSKPSESFDTKIFGDNIVSSTNSSEDSDVGAFGVSEVPLKLGTKSEETLRKVEDILQGSGTITTISALETARTMHIKDEVPSEKPISIPKKPPQFTYTNEVTNEDTITSPPTNSFDTSIIETVKTTTPKSNDSSPAILPPFIVVPNRNSTIGDQNTPQLPPTVFDKPTGERAPFIPILPPPMESSTGGLIPPTPAKIPFTLAPNLMTPTSRTLTPVEYGAIGVGSVLIFALIAFIYQKYKQFATSSSGGCYSPMGQHRAAPGRKRSSRSNNSEGGYSINEAENVAPIEMEPINSEVERATEVKIIEEVVETPVTKTVVNGLQKSSSNGNHDIQSIPDTIEVISEVEKPKPKDKPPRKSKTPISSPQKFTSDKTSASNLNEDSLKNVTHAIGGILRNQVPNETENQTSNEEDSSGDSDEKGVSLIGKLEGLVSTKPTGDNSEDAVIENMDGNDNIPEQDVTSDGEPLYKSIEKEVDAGSEYYSADEHSDAKNSPPRSPTLKKAFEEIPTRNLRAEDVYNTEIITEDGRRRSIEEDIAESIEEKKDDNSLSDTVEDESSPNEVETEDSPNESLKPSAPFLSEEVEFISEHRNTEHDCSRCGLHGIPKDIQMKNLINSTNANSQYNVKKEAEMIIDDILRTSQLDALTIQSIKQDLGDSESGRQRVKWSNNVENIEDEIIGHETQNYPTKKGRCDLDSFTWSETINDEAEYQISVSNTPKAVEELVVVEESSNQSIPQNMVDSSNSTNRDFQMDIAENIVENDREIRVVDDNEKDFLAGTTVGFNISEEDSSYLSQKMDTPNTSPSEDTLVNNQNIDSIDEGFPMEHKFEFIPPRQPQIFEDDLIVFSNSDQESISPLSNSTAEFNPANEEHLIAMSNENCELNLVPNTEKNSETIEENMGNRTKWYVPDDEVSSEPDLKSEAAEPGKGLYIVLSEEAPKLAPVERVITPTSFETSERNISGSPKKPKKETKNFSNISYAFIEVNDDPINEGWPEHLPKNIHSISGVGLIKTADNASLLHNPLKEEEPEVLPSTSVYKKDNIARDTQPDALTESSTTPTQKPIPKFILPNMDGRLNRKRALRRRQIKSLDSGVHHYYGEYLSLAELPEIDHENLKNEEEVKEETGVIEDVLTIKPDGTITQETIIIPNSN